MKKNKKTTSPQFEILYGLHPIIEALSARKRTIFKIFTTRPTPKRWHVVIDAIKNKIIPIEYVTREQLAKLAGTTDHQSVVAYASPFQYRVKPFTPDTTPFIAILDSIQDPRNTGAILRSAYCAGIDGIILTTSHSSGLTAAAVKASAGLSEYLQIQLQPSAITATIALKKAGYTMYAATIDGADIRTMEYNKPLCIIIGNEEQGIDKTIAAHTTKIMIPQKTPTISYNASVAAGILFFTIGSAIKKI